MSSYQANSARFIYTVNDYIPEIEGIQSCILKNGYYFTKVAKSDEKVFFTETNMFSIIRTVLFMHIFQLGPSDSIIDIINSGEVHYEFPDKDYVRVKRIDFANAITILDELFGTGFSHVTRRVLNKWYLEYKTSWEYFPFVAAVKLPCADDYGKLARFVNLSTSKHNETTQFILGNDKDNRYWLQNNTKHLVSRKYK